MPEETVPEKHHFGEYDTDVDLESLEPDYDAEETDEADEVFEDETDEVTS